MSSSTSFLGGAKDRLLPASVPFRFFAAATGFQLLFWIFLFLGAEDLANFSGGPGYILASLHLLTLGVLVMTVMGASFQLLPVATRQPLIRLWPVRLCFWFMVPGIFVLAVGMIEADPLYLYPGGMAVILGLAIFAILTALNLRKPGGMKIVAAHGWFSLLALGVFVLSGAILLLDFNTGFLEDRLSISMVHMIAASFGFMGVLVFGFSHILIPMFALARSLPVWPGRIEFVSSAFAVTAAVLSVYTGFWPGVVGSVFVGLLAGGAYLWLMKVVYQTRMRKRLGLSFVLIRASWVLMIFGLLIGVALVFDAPIPGGMVLFVFAILVGWFLTFLMGVLQRIMPFLASMHVKGENGRPLLLSELTAEKPLNIHALCHGTAFTSCIVGILFDWQIMIQIGAAFGVIGAIFFAIFAGHILFKFIK